MTGTRLEYVSLLGVWLGVTSFIQGGAKEGWQMKLFARHMVINVHFIIPFTVWNSDSLSTCSEARVWSGHCSSHRAMLHVNMLTALCLDPPAVTSAPRLRAPERQGLASHYPVPTTFCSIQDRPGRVVSGWSVMSTAGRKERDLPSKWSFTQRTQPVLRG